MLRILVLAPTPVERAGWRALISSADRDILVVAEAASSADLIVQLAASGPDLLLLDPGRHDDTVLAVLQSLTRARPGLLAVVVGEAASSSAIDAIRAGARGYVRLSATGAEVAVALRAVAEGLVVLDPAAAGPLLDRIGGLETTPVPPRPPAPNVTRRELEVLQLLAAGLTNRGIARRLQISEHTAKFHVSALLTKLTSGSRAEAVATAARLGLILD